MLLSATVLTYFCLARKNLNVSTSKKSHDEIFAKKFNLLFK